MEGVNITNTYLYTKPYNVTTYMKITCKKEYLMTNFTSCVSFFVAPALDTFSMCILFKKIQQFVN